MELIGRAGHVAGYDVLVSGDAVTVTRGSAIIDRQTVPNYGTAIGELSARPGPLPRRRRGHLMLR